MRTNKADYKVDYVHNVHNVHNVRACVQKLRYTKTPFMQKQS